MLLNSRRQILLTTIAACLLGSMSGLKAQIIAYDWFDYPSGTQLFGTAPGQGNGGYGWATTWSATSAALSTNLSPGLSYGAQPVVGGKVVLGNPFGSTGTSASSQRLLPGTLTTLAGGSGSIWISFYYQNWSTDNGGLSGFREAKMALFSGATANANGSANVNGSERLDVGTPNTYSAGANDTLTLWQGSTYSSSGIATPRGNNPANTVFVLLRMDVDATTGNDTAYAWFNPSLASEPSTGSAVMFNNTDLSPINALRFQAGNLNASGTNAVFAIDELYVGRSWADVVLVPEPAISVFCGLGGLVLVFSRARRK